MKRTVFIIAIIFLIEACQQKTLPTITTRTKDPERPVTRVADVKPDMIAGKMIFTNRCGRCHALPDPIQYTAQRWDGILVTMIPRARLDKEQEIHVTAYIKANCSK